VSSRGKVSRWHQVRCACAARGVWGEGSAGVGRVGGKGIGPAAVSYLRAEGRGGGACGGGLRRVGWGVTMRSCSVHVQVRQLLECVAHQLLSVTISYCQPFN